jgi:hypothetical protein
MVPLAPNLGSNKKEREFRNNKRRYKQKYLIEKVVRNQGLEKDKIAEQRKLNRYSRNK